MEQTTYNKIQSKVLNHIFHKYGENEEYALKILHALKLLLKSSYKKYGFPSTLTEFSSSNLDVCFQTDLSRVNEKESRKRNAGVYYTDHDVTDFMVSNAFSHFINPTLISVSRSEEVAFLFKNLCEDNIKKIFEARVFDPTCGSGEFLISALTLKILLYKSGVYDKKTLISLIETIKGNDIDILSTDISKIRLFFLIIDSIEEEIDVTEIAKTLNKCFGNLDMIDYKECQSCKYEIIVGNPPYIEYGKYEGSVSNSNGNVYADVIQNVIPMLSTNGVLAFVVPLSYIATKRMSQIRNHVQKHCGKQLLMNFADRPDCLFCGVHQKLTIILAQNTPMSNGVYSTKYNHWYKTERELIFTNLSLSKVDPTDVGYWPKLGDSIAASIYNKIQHYHGEDLLELNNTTALGSVFVNQRACFWMKVFSHDMYSNSYKEYKVGESQKPFILCLLNSSLFFLMWTIISDGWHITNKEISFIKIPSKIPKPQKWVELIDRLENKLEKTKTYVGTKQVQYEYKHKYCKDIIDKIDDELKDVYGLSETEIVYIKSFNEKYRMSDGA